MNKFDIQGHHLACKMQGQGIPVVLLHGFCEDSSVWDVLLHELRHEPCQWVTIDWPGFGQSDEVEDLSMEWMAEAVHALVTSLGIRRYLVIGHSMGGYAALALAERYGDNLLGLGLFHSHPYADTLEKKTARDRSITFVAQHGAEVFVRQLIPSLFAPAFARQNPELIGNLITKNASTSPVAIQAALAAMRDRPDRSAVLAQLKCPALFVIGLEDQAIPGDQSRAQITLAVVSAIHFLQDVGHMGMYESPVATAAILKDFVSFCQIYADTPD